MFVILALALLQQGQPSPEALRPSPVTRIAVSPARLVVGASDSLQLSAVAYDAAGRRVDDARLRFASVASNAGTIDSPGKVVARGTGKLAATVVSLLPGFKPTIQRFEVLMVPDAPARVQLGALPQRLVVGQRGGMGVEKVRARDIP